MSKVWIRNGALLVQNNTVVVRPDSGACCDSCPVLACAWANEEYAPLSGTYTLKLAGFGYSHAFTDWPDDPPYVADDCGITGSPHNTGDCVFSGSAAEACSTGNQHTQCTDGEVVWDLAAGVPLCTWEYGGSGVTLCQPVGVHPTYPSYIYSAKLEVEEVAGVPANWLTTVTAKLSAYPARTWEFRKAYGTGSPIGNSDSVSVLSSVSGAQSGSLGDSFIITYEYSTDAVWCEGWTKCSIE